MRPASRGQRRRLRHRASRFVAFEVQDFFGWGVIHAHALGYGFVRDLALRNVDTRLEARDAADRPDDAVVGERQRVRQGRVRQRVGRSDRHRAGHVRHAVVDDPVDLVGRIGMGRRLGGLEAAALVDRHVHQDCALPHQAELLAGDHMRRPGSMNEDAADDEVDVRQALLDRECRREDRRSPTPEDNVELAKAVDGLVVDENVRLHADRDEGRVHPDGAAADDHHIGGGALRARHQGGRRARPGASRA